MTNIFLSKKIIIPAVIFFGGLLIASGILTLANFTVAQLSIASQLSQWTQETGAGISAPACTSAGTAITCVNSTPEITVAWLGAHGCDNTMISFEVAPGAVQQNWGPDAVVSNAGWAGFSITEKRMFARRFRANDSYTIKQVSFQVARGTMTGSEGPVVSQTPTRVTVETDAAGFPSGTILGTSEVYDSVRVCVWGPCFTLMTLIFSGAGVPVTAGSDYWFVVRADPATIWWDAMYLPAATSLGAGGRDPDPAAKSLVSYLSQFENRPLEPVDVDISYKIHTLPAGINAGRTVGGLTPCNSGDYTWTEGSSNTAYNYFVSTRVGITTSELAGPISAPTPNCAPAPTVSMTANPLTINLGQSSTLSWSSSNATSCSIDQGIGGVAVNDSISVSPTTNTTYTITCSGPTAPPAQSSASITVNQPPGDFTLSAGGGLACNSVPLSWTASAGATAYRILKGSPRVDISPYQPYTALNFTDNSVSQNTNYIYQIEAYNGSGTNRSNTLNMTTPFCPPALSFSGNPTTIFQGQSTTLNWSSTYATSCTASGAWSGSKAVNGSEVVVPPPPSATYTLTCTGPGGSTGPQSVIISITPLALPEWKEIIPR
ncbi:MAG: hypothetical protein Q7R61_01635 [bacterium]|nr:hypothetical protein [bacterium]